MASKPQIKYHLTNGRNPKTSEALLIPKVTEQQELDTDLFVNYALNGNYVTGKFEYMKGILNGFIQAIQQAAKDGYAIILDNWLAIRGQLRGSVDFLAGLSGIAPCRARVVRWDA